MFRNNKLNPTRRFSVIEKLLKHIREKQKKMLKKNSSIY